MFLLRSDLVFTFTTLLGTKPPAYGNFTKDLKGLLKQLGLGTGSVTVLGQQILYAPDCHSL